MGYDKTPSRDATIFRVGIVTVVVLALALPMLRGYFFHVLEPLQAQRAAGAGRSQLDGYHADQARALGGIDAALTALGQRGRSGSPAIAPRASGSPDLDAVEGWAQMKDEPAAAAARTAFEHAEAVRVAQLQANMPDGGLPIDGSAPAPAPQDAPAPTPVAPAPGTP